MRSLLVLAAGFAFATPAVPAAQPRTSPEYVPVVYEPNRGQARANTLFLTRSPRMAMEIRRRGARLILREGGLSDEALEIQMVGARSRSAVGKNSLSSRSNYFLGTRKLTGIPHYGEVWQAGIYDGIDLVYHSRENQLEFDFRVAPHADPGVIHLRYGGMKELKNENGDLVVRLGHMAVVQHRPQVYQIIDGSRREVAGDYAVRGDDVSFRVGGYDPTHELIIDPVLSYSTFLGGTLGDAANGVATDSLGNAYVTGSTSSLGLASGSAFQNVYGSGLHDVFVAKLNAAGNTLLYLTYLGGSGDDLGRSIAIDGQGQAYLTGQTDSANFPLQGAVKATLGMAGKRAFMTKLSAAGDALIYSTYFGNAGSTDDWANAIAVDSQGAAYITGATHGGLTLVNPVQTIPGLSSDAFVAKLNPAGTAFAYTTYLGGGNGDEGFGIAVDSIGQAVVTGSTHSSDFPTSNAKQPTLAAFNDAFVTKYNAAGSAYVYSTFLGDASGSSEGRAVAVDSLSNAYVTGLTQATNFPLLNAAQGTRKGFQDAFVTAYAPSGSAFLYSTYLGGTSAESGLAISSDANGNVAVGGVTGSRDFPEVTSLQGSGSVASTVFKSTDSSATWNPTNSILDVLNITVDPNNASNIYAVTPGAIFQSTNGGGSWNSIVTVSVPLAFNSLAIDPADSCNLYAGINGQFSFGIFTGPTGASRIGCNASWVGTPPLFEEYRRLMTAAPTVPATLYWLTGFRSGGFPAPQICRGQNLGTFACSGINFALTLAVDPGNSCVIYVGGFNGSVSQNTSCAAFSFANLPALPADVSALAVSPTDSTTIFAGLANGGIYRKIGAGAWTLMQTLDGSVSALTFQPGSGTILYAGTGGDSKGSGFYATVGGGSIYKSSNGGASFTRTSFVGGSVTQIGISPASVGTVYSSSNAHTDGFVTRYTAAGALVFSTYHGGAHAESVNGISLSASGDIYVSGYTQSYNYPATVGAAATAYSGLSDAFVAKIGSGSRPTSVGVFRSGFFWLQDVDGNQQFNSPPDKAFAFGGVAGDIPISGDWNGNGTTKVGVYRPSNGLFVLDYDGDGQFTGADKAYNLGVGIDPTDKPVVGDWNGDGKTKVGLFRQGFFWILDTNGNGVFQQGIDQTYAFGGVAGDVPVVGDWNGTGTTKIGLFRLGFFWILDVNGNGSIDNVNGAGGDQAFAFGGLPGDVPMVGDWNGDGKSKVGVFRSGFFWVLDANGNHTFDGTGVGQDLSFPFGGISGDKPVVGKW